METFKQRKLEKLIQKDKNMINIGSLLGVQKTSTTFLKDNNSTKTITAEYSEKSSKIMIGVAMLSILGVTLLGVGSALFSKNGSISKPQGGGNDRPPKKGGMVRGISSGQRG